MSTVEPTTNKAAYTRIIDAVNSGDRDAMARTGDELIDPTLVNPGPLAHGATGAAAFMEVFRVLRQAFPDLHITVQELIAEGDKVVCQNTVTGTHVGEFLGIPPTGNAVSYDEIFIMRFVDGRIVEASGVVDVLSQLRQIGALPVPPLPTVNS
jgi:steroid delta-isomerase-like uncharacterized protein